MTGYKELYPYGTDRVDRLALVETSEEGDSTREQGRHQQLTACTTRAV